MSEENQTAVTLETPAIEVRGPLLLAGLREHYTADTAKDIPALWTRFAPSIGSVPGQVDQAAYGVVFGMTPGVEGFDYMAAVAIRDAAKVGDRLVIVLVPEQRYAVFPHRGHVMALKHTMDAIWEQWMPTTVHKAAVPTSDEAGMIEFYGEEFDPQTGMGGMEVWVPLVS